MTRFALVALAFSGCASSEEPSIDAGSEPVVGCPSGQVSCDETGFQVKICNEDGITFITVPCTADEYCRAGACYPKVCQPNERTCVGRRVQICTADGSGYLGNAGTNCEAANLWCYNGACVQQGLLAKPAVVAIAEEPEVPRDAEGRAEVAMGSTVTFSAAESVGLNNTAVVAFEWSLAAADGAELPGRRTLRLTAPEAMETHLIDTESNGLVILGTYRIALRVMDSSGWSPWTTVEFVVKPIGALHVEVSWNHETSDVDLHLIRGANPQRYGTPDDCHVANCNDQTTPLRWGSVDRANDPLMGLVDDHGFGPEQIYVGTPELEESYLPAVHYARSDQWATVATMRIYFEGELHIEESKLLPRTGVWWSPGVIRWSQTPTFELDEIMTDQPPGN
jgi:hypothetical protein